jgi:riboflavin transporter FmnP
MTKVAILSVIAFLIMYIEFPIVFFPAFLKIDLSDLPALIAGFALGPVAGIMVELIKNLLHLFQTSTGGVGELANFVIGVALVGPASAIYYRDKSRKSAIIGMLVGIVSMAIVGALANYFVLIPFYQNFMPIDAIIAMGQQANAAIVDVRTLVIYGVVPFNLLKGFVIMVITALIYKKISPLLK